MSSLVLIIAVALMMGIGSRSDGDSVLVFAVGDAGGVRYDFSFESLSTIQPSELSTAIFNYFKNSNPTTTLAAAPTLDVVYNECVDSPYCDLNTFFTGSNAGQYDSLFSTSYNLHDMRESFQSESPSLLLLSLQIQIPSTTTDASTTTTTMASTTSTPANTTPTMPSTANTTTTTTATMPSTTAAASNTTTPAFSTTTTAMPTSSGMSGGSMSGSSQPSSSTAQESTTATTMPPVTSGSTTTAPVSSTTGQSKISSTAPTSSMAGSTTAASTTTSLPSSSSSAPGSTMTSTSLTSASNTANSATTATSTTTTASSTTTPTTSTTNSTTPASTGSTTMTSTTTTQTTTTQTTSTSPPTTLDWIYVVFVGDVSWSSSDFPPGSIVSRMFKSKAASSIAQFKAQLSSLLGSSPIVFIPVNSPPLEYMAPSNHTTFNFTFGGGDAAATSKKFVALSSSQLASMGVLRSSHAASINVPNGDGEDVPLLSRSVIIGLAVGGSVALIAVIAVVITIRRRQDGDAHNDVGSVDYEAESLYAMDHP